MSQIGGMNDISLVESFEEFVRMASHHVERSKVFEKELNLLRDEITHKQKKLNELQAKISTFEINENITDTNVNVQDYVKDARMISSLETEKAQIEDELLNVRYENARLKSEKEYLERSLILNKSLYERELQKYRRQNFQWEKEEAIDESKSKAAKLEGIGTPM